jgi:hypothetical protein
VSERGPAEGGDHDDEQRADERLTQRVDRAPPGR